jgi:thiamine-phosphate pyrophosphorylase
MGMKAITGGVYVVVDPVRHAVLDRVAKALEGGADVLQIWNHWRPGQEPKHFVEDLIRIAEPFNVPVLVNENLELLTDLPLDGIHFDTISTGKIEAVRSLNRQVIVGITTSNNTGQITEALLHGVDYLSFCSMFPSSSASVCELVSPEVVQATRAKTGIPIFASGGITPANTAKVLRLGVDGIAVISGVLSSPDPARAVRGYKQVINEFMKSKNSQNEKTTAG